LSTPSEEPGMASDRPSERPLSAGPDLRVGSLLGAAIDGHLLIYAGAGISVNSGLPTGARLSMKLHARLTMLGHDLSAIEEWDLLAVADTVGIDASGVLTLQGAALAAAPFTTAPPSPAHRALALLLLEGAVQLLTTNWDTCIERATAERIISVISSADRSQVRTHSLLKVHGCAERPDTLLITSAQLTEPPLWAQTEIAAALSRDTVVFLGIGDVAPYVRISLEALLQDLGDVARVRVVAPEVERDWDATRWSDVLPDLAPDNRWGLTAEEFAQGLLSAWVNSALMDIKDRADTADQDSLTAAVDSLVTVVRRYDADRVLSWLRRSHLVQRPGHSLARDGHTCEAFMALAVLAQEHPLDGVPARGPLRAGQHTIDLVITSDSLAANALVDEALARAVAYRQSGDLGPADELMVICSGHFGRLPPPTPLPCPWTSWMTPMEAW
jgi:hypothetical protein